MNEEEANLSYVVKIKGRTEREALIAKGVAATKLPPYPFHEFRSQRIELSVANIAIDVPIYRMQNFRTFTDQAEYVSKEGLPADYFLSGQEIETVQQVQHESLAKLAERGVSKSLSIHDVLKREKQREPLLITASGVVVNGNRRLAAMRELYSDGSGDYAQFGYVQCAVLPADATLSDVLDIEASLQAKTDTKLDYDWVGDAQLMNAMVLQHNGTAEVSRRLNRSDKEIRNTIQALAEADLYLKEWVGSPGKYSLVRGDGQQLFGDLPKLLDGKEPSLQQASRVIAWTLYENGEKLNDRLYNFNPAVGRLASDVMDRIIDKLGIPTDDETDENEDDFDVDFGGDAPGPNYDAIIEQLKDPTTKSEVVDALVDAAQTSIEVEKGQKSSKAALKAVGQAHSKLVSIDVSRAAIETHQPMRKQLESIKTLADSLIKKIDNYKKA